MKEEESKEHNNRNRGAGWCQGVNGVKGGAGWWTSQLTKRGQSQRLSRHVLPAHRQHHQQTHAVQSAVPILPFTPAVQPHHRPLPPPASLLCSPVICLHLLCQPLPQCNVVPDEGLQLLSAVHAQHKPQLERTEAPAGRIVG